MTHKGWRVVKPQHNQVPVVQGMYQGFADWKVIVLAFA